MNYLRIILLVVLLMALPARAEDAIEEKKNDLTLQDALPFDMVYGDSNAPVTIVEYASLSCSHCQHFHENIFPKIKEHYINTGKAKFIYRHFPLNAPALQAALLVECVSPQNSKQLFMDLLFKSQGDWAYTEKFSEKLKEFWKKNGFDEKEFDTCIVNKNQENLLLFFQMRAQKEWGVRSTPTFFVGGKRLEKRGFEDIAKAVDDLIKK